MVLRQVGVMVVMGATLGVFGAYAVGRAAQSLLFGLQGHDPVVFVSAVVLLAAVAFGAGWLPARRASKTQPMMALRYDWPPRKRQAGNDSRRHAAPRARLGE